MVTLTFQLDNILDAEKLLKEISFLEKSLESRRRDGDPLAKAGLQFILETRRRDNQKTGRGGEADPKDWSFSEKMQLLLKWARLVCAHYAIEVC